MIQPVDDLFSGTTDVNGVFTSDQRKPVPTLWGALKVVASTTGNAQWAIVVGGVSKAFGRGPRVDIPILVQPGQGVQIQIVGALPSSPVSGVLTGMGGTTLEEITSYISLVPNAITVDTAAQELLVGTVIATATTTNTGSFVVPPGAVSIGYGVDFSGGAVSPVNVKITGNQTLTVYRNDANPGIPPVHASLLMITDTSVTLSVTAPAGGPSRVRLYAWTAPVAMTVSPDVSVPFPVTFQNVAANFVAQAAPWMAPTAIVHINAAIGAGGTLLLVPATGGVTVYLHDLDLEQTAAVAANELAVQDTAPASQHGFDMATIVHHKPFKGVPFATGLGVQLANGGGVAVGIRGSLTYALG